MAVPNINSKYKDRLFRLVFEDKKDLLDLYNAVAQRDYKDPEEREITTLSGTLSGVQGDDAEYQLWA